VLLSISSSRKITKKRLEGKPIGKTEGALPQRAFFLIMLEYFNNIISQFSYLVYRFFL
jgi:hypothetical protein